MANKRYVDVYLDQSGDLVWSGQDLGPDDEYEFWRTIRAAHVPALIAALGGVPSEDIPLLVRSRFSSDKALAEFASAHGIPTEFDNRISW